MTDSKLSREVVSRVLQITQQSWISPAQATAALTPSRQKLSSHRMAVQTTARNRRMAWGLQPTSRLAG